MQDDVNTQSIVIYNFDHQAFLSRRSNIISQQIALNRVMK